MEPENKTPAIRYDEGSVMLKETFANIVFRTTNRNEKTKDGSKYRVTGYYFDENGICRTMTGEELLKTQKVKSNTLIRNDGKIVSWVNAFDYDSILEGKKDGKPYRNANLLVRIFSQITEGDDTKKLVAAAENTSIRILNGQRPKDVDGVPEGLFTVRKKIDIRNYTTRKDLFSFIDVTVLCSSGATRSDIDRYRNVLAQKAFKTIKVSPKYQKYKIPPEYLKIGNCVHTRDNRIIYTFELKSFEKVD